MNAFIGKAFFWIFGFISLLIFTTQTSVGRFLSNAFLILIGVFAVMTLLGEMGILEWAGKFKTLSSESKLLILSTFFFFGLWLFVQYDVVNNFRADINESNIQSENEKIRQARNDIDNIFLHKDFLISGEIKYRVTYTGTAFRDNVYTGGDKFNLGFELLEHPYIDASNIIFRYDKVNNLLFTEEQNIEIENIKNIFTVELKVES
tara:strand:- start:2034 stop:2648 length:615 start_codon:yes stop_codon:yes gene_type:complete